MNQVFDFTRFRLLMARHWAENRLRYLMSLGAVAGLLLLWFIFAFLMERGTSAAGEDFQRATYYFGLFLTGSLFASSIFAPLGSKGKGINYLSIPASQFEKILVAFLYAVVIFFICYTAVFYAIDFLMLKVTNPIAEGNFKPYYIGHKFVPEPLANMYYKASFDEVPVFYYLLMCYFGIQSAFVAGSVFFNKFNFIKTVLTMLVLGFLFWLVMYVVVLTMMPEGHFSNEDLTGYLVVSEQGSAQVKIPVWMVMGSKLFYLYGLTLFLWLASWRRLNEKEI